MAKFKVFYRLGPQYAPTEVYEIEADKRKMHGQLIVFVRDDESEVASFPIDNVHHIEGDDGVQHRRIRPGGA